MAVSVATDGVEGLSPGGVGALSVVAAVLLEVAGDGLTSGVVVEDVAACVGSVMDAWVDVVLGTGS